VTFRLLAFVVLALGVLVLVAGLAVEGVGPGATPEGLHLRRMKNRTEAPAHVEPITVDEVAALPHGLPVPKRAEIEARGVRIEGWNQRMMLASDGDVHLEITPAPRRSGGLDTTYATAEITPRWRDGHPGWSYAKLLQAFRPNTGGSTRWDAGPRRVRVTGWLLYDYQYDAIPSTWSLTHGACRVSGWEIHPVTRIEAWDDARGGWVEVVR
jgi:hypothetical protein